jgi:hypothetical protein
LTGILRMVTVVPMLYAPLHRHFPKSPIARRDKAIRAELTHLNTELLKIEKEQDIQLRRIAQLQQDLDEVKRLLKKLSAE